MKVRITRKAALCAAIAVLAAVYTLQLILGAPDTVKVESLAGTPDAIEITRPGMAALRLTESGGKWLIGDKGYPADGARVEAMTKALGTIKILGRVSGDAESGEYGLGEAERLLVTAWKDGKKLRSLTVGKNAVTAQQSYVQLDDGSDVLLVSGALKGVFDRDTDSLRDKTIWTLTADALSRVSVSGGKSWAIEKSGEPPVWALAAGSSVTGELDAEKAVSWVSGLLSVKASGFVPGDGELPAATLGKVALTAGGKEYWIAVHEKGEDNRYLCSSSESPYAFYLSAAAAEKFLKPAADLLK